MLSEKIVLTELREQGVKPFATRRLVIAVVEETLADARPHILINTESERLCNKQKQIEAFKAHPQRSSPMAPGEQPLRDTSAILRSPRPGRMKANQNSPLSKIGQWTISRSHFQTRNCKRSARKPTSTVTCGLGVTLVVSTRPKERLWTCQFDPCIDGIPDRPSR